MSHPAVHYLIVPGWQGSPEDHWQSHWQACLPNGSRVEQDDWLLPQRAAWVARLDEVVRASSDPLILIAHSLGCVTVAAWAAQAEYADVARVRGALLVAPADVERDGCAEALRNFAPISRAPLPFASLLVGSDNDPAATPRSALQLANSWGSDAVVLSGVGHINPSSGFDRWDEGFAHLYRLQERIGQGGRLTA